MVIIFIISIKSELTKKTLSPKIKVIIDSYTNLEYGYKKPQRTKPNIFSHLAGLALAYIDQDNNTVMHKPKKRCLKKYGRSKPPNVFDKKSRIQNSP